MKELSWPAWFTGPKGETVIFESAEDVPNGWTSGAEKRSAKSEPAKVAPPKTPPPAKTSEKAPTDELDAHGHAYDAALHAATKSKTKAGLWRMKVGVARPDPAPGFPLDL